MILAPVVIAAVVLCAPAAASARLIYVAPDDESAGFLCTEAQPCALAIGGHHVRPSFGKLLHHDAADAPRGASDHNRLPGEIKPDVHAWPSFPNLICAHAQRHRRAVYDDGLAVRASCPGSGVIDISALWQDDAAALIVNDVATGDANPEEE